MVTFVSRGSEASGDEMSALGRNAVGLQQPRIHCVASRRGHCVPENLARTTGILHKYRCNVVLPIWETGPTMTENDREIVLSAAEIMRRIDTQSRRRIGMSGEEMVSAYAAGTLSEPTRVSDLLLMSDLLPREETQDAGRKRT